MKEEAVSTVIGAVMIMALLVITMVTVQTQYTPVWEQTREMEQADEAFNAFARLKSSVDQQLTNGTQVPITVPIPMGSREDGRFLKTPGVGASLEFEPDVSPSEVSAPAMSLFRQNGKRLGVLNEDWQTSNGTNSVTSIGAIDSLRIRLTAPPDEKLDLKKFSYVRLTFTDANGEYGGEFRAYVPEKDKEDVWARIETATGEVLIDQEIIGNTKFKEHGLMWINVLDPSLPFREILDAMEAPFEFAMGYDFPEMSADKWPAVEYAASYTTLTAEGEQLFVGGFGTQTVSNFQRDYNGGRLEYDLRSSRLPQHTLVYEHGAVLRVQEDGAAMVIEPNLFLRKSGSYTFLDGTMPSLSGKQSSVDRVGATGISVRGAVATTFVGTAAEFTINVTTNHTEAWRDYFEDVARDSGLEVLTGFEVDEQGAYVRFTIKGLDSDPLAHDLQVNFRRAPVTLTLGS